MKSWKIGLRSAATDNVQEMMEGCEMRKIKNWSHDLTEKQCKFNAHNRNCDYISNMTAWT